MFGDFEKENLVQAFVARKELKKLHATQMELQEALHYGKKEKNALQSYFIIQIALQNELSTILPFLPF